MKKKIKDRTDPDHYYSMVDQNKMNVGQIKQMILSV